MQTHLTEPMQATTQLPQLHEPRNQVMPLDLRWVAASAGSVRWVCKAPSLDLYHGGMPAPDWQVLTGWSINYPGCTTVF